MIDFNKIFEIRNKKISFYVFDVTEDCLVSKVRKIFFESYKDGKFELELKDVKVYHEINIPFVDFFSTEEYKLSKFLLKNEILIDKGETIMVSVKKNDN